MSDSKHEPDARGWSSDDRCRRDDSPGCGGDAATREDSMIAFRKALDVCHAKS